MSTFLLILKIIGIVLLSIIGLVLFLIALILFVPIRYRIKAEYDEKIDANVKVSYLLHIFTVIFKFDGSSPDLKIKIFGIKLPEKKETDNKKSKKKEPKQKEPKQKEPEYTLEGFDEEEVLPQTDYSEVNCDDIPDIEEEPKGFFGKLKEYLKFVYDFICSFKEKVIAVWNKIKGIKDNIEYYLDLITSERTKKTLSYGLRIVKKIFAAFKPTKLKGRFRFGFDDPSTTGRILSVLAVTYPITRDKIEIIPEFDEKIIEGNLFIKGRIFIITLLIQGWKLYFNKDIRKLAKDLKRN